MTIVNEQNAWVPRGHWITNQERQAMESFARGNSLVGHRRLICMMLDDNVGRL